MNLGRTLYEICRGAAYCSPKQQLLLVDLRVVDVVDQRAAAGGTAWCSLHREGGARDWFYVWRGLRSGNRGSFSFGQMKNNHMRVIKTDECTL